MIEILIFSIVFLGMRYYISFARRRNIGQLIKKDGPDLHGYKEGTPTMGGVVFIPVALAFMAMKGEDPFVILSTLGYFLLGVADDLMGIIRKDAYSMRMRTKITVQILLALALLPLCTGSTKAWVPFLDEPLDLGALYIPFALFLLVGTSNAVNLTDGLDGLAGWVFLSGSIPMYAVSRDDGEALLMMASAVLAFLIYNSKPASVFMGDAGSMALGAFLASYSLKHGLGLYLALFGFVFVIETLSVMIQVASYKLTRKRVFLMAPIHHHFELLGWEEGKIVFVFTAINLMASVVALEGWI